MKVAFIDRDGTIVRDYADEIWPTIFEPEFLPGAIDALAAIRKKEYQIIILTNQYLIGEKKLLLQQYEQFTTAIFETLSVYGIDILDILYCPDRRDDPNNRLKPHPYLIESALYKYPDIDLDESFVAGDAPTDGSLAQSFNLTFFAIGFDPSYGHRVSSLAEVVDYV